MQNLMEDLLKLLKKDERLVSQDGVLLKNQTQELARKNDPELIKLLLFAKAIKQHFFFEVEKALVFDKEKFIRFVSNKQFLPDSYTAFKNKIGLTAGEEYMSEGKEVVLAWPYKDCVLEGGMTKEDQKRDEIFYNETLAPDDINRLLDPKVFTNFKRIDKKGEHKLDGFNRDEKGKIKDNLIIKGNNLLALASLKKEFAGKVKCIYIDPPFNPDSKSNTFTYNNAFNHSTWLTFMRNRLVIAKTLLTKDGSLICAIDENEREYLGVLLREIFKEYEVHCVEIVHNPRGIQGTNFSYTHESAYFVFPKGKKIICDRYIEEDEIDWRNLRDNGGESLRTDAKNCFYAIIVKDGKVVGFGDVLERDKHPHNQTEELKGKKYVYPIDPEGIERKWRYARQSVEEIMSLLRVKEKDGKCEIEIGKDFGMQRTVWIGAKYDANEYGTKLMKSLAPTCEFKFPKSLYNVLDCLHAIVSEDKDAIILDFFGGSGTTAHAVIELNAKDTGNRRYILIEQMDYIDRCTIARISNVYKQKASNGGFVYMELAKWNEEWVEKIKKAKTGKELVKLWDYMKENAFLSYKIDPKAVDANAKEFADLSIADQKKFLVECLDKNQLYINLSEIEDKEYGVSKDDKDLNKSFYNGK